MNEFKKSLKFKNAKINMPTMYNMYDEDGNYIAKINGKYEKLQNRFLKGITILLETQDGRIVMEHRGNTKLNKCQDDFCSGHVDDNETYMQAAYREAKEELGIEVKNLTKILEPVPLNFEGRKFFIQFFYGKCNSNDIKIDNKEVATYYTEEVQSAFEKLRKGKTKFPYKGNEIEFEEIIREYNKICEKYKNSEKVDKEEVK